MSFDSSEDENLELLKEAADPKLFNDAMFKQEDKTFSQLESANELEVGQPSMRPNRNENDHNMNPFRVTPEFQKHVAKQLSSLLDKQLEYIGHTEEKAPKDKRRKKKIKSHVRLLKESQVYLEVDKNNVGERIINAQSYTGHVSNGQADNTLKNRKKPELRKRIVDEESTYSSEGDKCKAVAVAPDLILNKEETKFWSKRTKGVTFKYRKLKNGKLELVEPDFQ